MEKKRILLTLASAVLALSASGCGKSAPDSTSGSVSRITTSPAPLPSLSPLSLPGTCGAGTISLGGLPCVQGDLPTACRLQGGLMTAISGKPVCKINLYFNVFTRSGPTTQAGTGVFYFKTLDTLPRLGPDSASGSEAFDTGMPVSPGDYLTLSADGAWGSRNIKVSSFLDGIFNFYSSNINCSEVTVQGKKEGKTLKNKENGAPAGLFVSDGTEAVLVGKSLKRVVANAGRLFIGFNAPQVQGACSEAWITRLTVAHCQDADGKSYPCK